MNQIPPSIAPFRATRVEPSGNALRFLPEASYADSFRVTDAPAAPARAWAQACLASGPEIQSRIFGTLVWHGLLGLDIASPDTPGSMVGWHVEVDEPDLFVLTTGGTRMSGAMVFVVEEQAVTWTTAVRYLHPTAKTVWAGAQRVHRALAGRLLSGAARTIERRGELSR